MSEKKYLDLSGLGLFLDNLKKSRPVIELTSAEYASLEQSGEIDPKAFYFITDSDVAGRNPDTSMSDYSTNTVQNKVIKAYVDSHSGGGGTVDTEMSDSSTNAVQNKVIKSYVDSQISALRTELIAMINSITDVTASDSAPSDTSKIWIDTGA